MDEKREPAEIKDLEIEPLSDSDLDSVAGGLSEDSSACSCCETQSYCTGGSEIEA